MNANTEKTVVPAIAVRAVSKTFATAGGVVQAVDGVDLEIAHGEFFCLLGPSGSGKTTLLRMIAGFEVPTSGSIFLDGLDVTTRPPFERNVNTVFQDYALFPHMTVTQNVEYGLKVKRVEKAERHRRAAEALEQVRLRDFGSRKPSQLSGGQRQRVALARALVNRPKVLLLDEPLGALDLKLREEMQIELKRIQHEVGITFVFVTHDQDEALSMSDRIAVFNRGSIEQVGTPQEIYDAPTTPFVAGFVGTSNLFEGDIAQRLCGSSGPVTVRPEAIVVLSGSTVAPDDAVDFDASIIQVEYLGATTRVRASLSATTVPGSSPPVVVELSSEEASMFAPGQAIRLRIHRDAIRALRDGNEASSNAR